MEDMPKIESPFVRQEIDGAYVVTPNIAEGCEWVFEDDLVMAVEKLDGTNVSIFIDEGRLVGLRNRTNVIPHDTLQSNRFLEGVRTAYAKGRVPVVQGQHFGELMGSKIQGNFLKLEGVEWFPFAYMQKKWTYQSWHKYPKTFENISSWFQGDLFSLAYSSIHGQKVQPEGIVFTHPDGRMAKLRRDMFDWYKGRRHNQ